MHSYGKSDELGKNPRYQANFLAWIAAAQVQDKPLAITEWSVEHPIADRFTSLLVSGEHCLVAGLGHADDF